MHVFEPAYNDNGIGQHVYFSNKTGMFGDLDVDNMSGYGPEHYNVQCDALVTGKYEFAVDYYGDRGSDTSAKYTLNVKAGNQTRPFTGVIAIPEDTDSSSPKKEGYVEVFEENGIAQYRIVGY